MGVVPMHSDMADDGQCLTSQDLSQHTELTRYEHICCIHAVKVESLRVCFSPNGAQPSLELTTLPRNMRMLTVVPWLEPAILLL